MTKLCLALDVPTLDAAASLVDNTHEVFDTYKVGLELFCAHGWTAVDRLRGHGAQSIFGSKATRYSSNRSPKHSCDG